MRGLFLDPGAERCGWCVFDKADKEKPKNKPPVHVGWGHSGVKRERNESKTEPFQKYRLRLIDFFISEADRLLSNYRPDVVVAEIVPVVGGGNFVAATQSQLASTALTVIQVEARRRDIPVEQIGATTIKARIGGSKKATKVAVRNGVFKLMPEMERFAKEWKALKIFDVSDACGVGLAYWGYKL